MLNLCTNVVYGKHKLQCNFLLLRSTITMQQQNQIEMLVSALKYAGTLLRRFVGINLYVFEILYMHIYISEMKIL